MHAKPSGGRAPHDHATPPPGCVKADPNRFLDVGCGSGEYRFLFPGCQYTGIDIVDHAFALKQEPGITLKVGDACCLPEESRSFDLVFSSGRVRVLP